MQSLELTAAQPERANVHLQIFRANRRQSDQDPPRELGAAGVRAASASVSAGELPPGRRLTYGTDQTLHDKPTTHGHGTEY